MLPRLLPSDDRLGKSIALENVPSLFDIPSEFGRFEHRINLPDGRWRIADVAFDFPSGFLVVIEIQLAAITPEQLEERTKDYESVGANSYWWFGKNAASQSNIEWYQNRFGVSPMLFTEFTQTI